MSEIDFDASPRNEITTCKVCDLPLKPKEYSSENLAFSKDKTRSYYICNKCRKKMLQMHEQANLFIAKDVFWASVRP
jgi:hypothetical protein